MSNVVLWRIPSLPFDNIFVIAVKFDLDHWWKTDLVIVTRHKDFDRNATLLQIDQRCDVDVHVAPFRGFGSWSCVRIPLTVKGLLQQSSKVGRDDLQLLVNCSPLRSFVRVLPDIDNPVVLLLCETTPPGSQHQWTNEIPLETV